MVKPGFYNKQDISDAIKRLRAPGALFHFNENGTGETPLFYKKKRDKNKDEAGSSEEQGGVGLAEMPESGKHALGEQGVVLAKRSSRRESAAGRNAL